MRVLSLVTQKGGTGKSALTVSLAVAAEAAGEHVCILDLDPQGTSASWYEARSAETPAVLSLDQVGPLAKLSETLSRLRAAGYTLAILDTAGRDDANREPMRLATLALVPVRPSEADVRATMPTVRALEALGRPYALLINQAPSGRQARLTAAVSMRLSTSGEVVPVPVASRIDHQYAYALGQGVQEYAPDGKAAAEVAEVWAWCRKRMENDHGRKA